MNISNFKYIIILQQMIDEQKASIHEKNRTLDKASKMFAGDKLTRMHASRKINKYIQALLQADCEYDNLLGKQLKLEREYVRKLQKDKLWHEIAEKTQQDVCGIYTLGEISDILGLTRERIRQIEHASLKVLKHPDILRKMKEIQYE